MLEDALLNRPGRLVIGGVPEGVDALLIARLARAGGHDASAPVDLVHIAREDTRLNALQDALAFFAPDLEVLTFPAWDCLPYDRISPNASIAARRMDTLGQLCAGRTTTAPRVLLTTVNAAGQHLPPKQMVEANSLIARPGDELSTDTLITFLVENGFNRTSAVMDAGEFAIRGGIVDVFPPGAEQPLRLDFFGDELETIRRFDPLDQISTGTAETLRLVPVSEVHLDDASIERFRKGYRETFGAVTGSDPLYEAISEGRKYQGMEHWLPLFHQHLDNLFDYAPGARVSVDPLGLEAFTSRQETVREQFEARRRQDEDADVHYKPLPPERLYLGASEWDAALDDSGARLFDAYQRPGGEGVINWGASKGRDFAPERNQKDVNIYDALREHLIALVDSGKQVLLASYSEGARERLKTVLADHGMSQTGLVAGIDELEALPRNVAALAVLRLEHGFETGKLALITEQDILGDRLIRKTRRTRRAENFIREASSLEEGDIIIHVDHGIGRYEGLETLDISGAPHDCVRLVYDGGDKLYVPVENIEVLSRYGSEDAVVQLDRLGGQQWQNRKAKMKQRLREMADELIKIAATRQLKEAPQFEVPAGLYDEFAARFPYQETEDQDRAIDEVLKDLQQGHPMDRLICGDVGFGKTEVALRAAFIAAMNGGQVALIAPTTLLVRQHLKSFRERFAGLPIRIEQLSRLVSSTESKRIREDMKAGKVDIVIGTHALLSKATEFSQLGLVIIDEEQHFGVRHKERLKQLRENVHVLTMTATPIPRTLQLSMTGLRELSLIATPPIDRLAVRTFVMPFDELTVREALLREHYRGGQSYYVCPRISDLAEAETFLKEMVPEVKYVVAHGQMPARQLEEVMNAFYDGTYDVLLSTTIIESGLDIPSANTMILHRADHFGLAQLYQLRGRIGRSKVRAYAYVTTPPGRVLTKNAEKRLKVLQSLDELGAGFSLASHDLDIRGAGNLLGEEQSGHIKEVGVELYQHMLEEAVAQARASVDGKDVALTESWSAQVNLGTAVLIPEYYVPDLSVRMGLYRRIAELGTSQEIEDLAAEMIDRFGALPREVESLLKIVEIKQYCRDAGISRLEAGPRGAIVTFHNDQFANPAALVEYLSSKSGTARLRPDHRLVLKRDWQDMDQRVRGALEVARTLARLARMEEAA